MAILIRKWRRDHIWFRAAEDSVKSKRAWVLQYAQTIWLSYILLSEPFLKISSYAVSSYRGVGRRQGIGQEL